MSIQIKVELTDGTAGVGAAKDANIKIDSTDNGTDSSTYSHGPRIEFNTPSPFFGSYPWDVKISYGGGDAEAFKTFTYSYPKLKVAKTIKEALEKKKPAAFLMPSISPPPPPPPPPPPSVRLLAIYKEDGVPISGIAWFAGVESGVTDSMGQIWINDFGPVTLIMLNFETGPFVDSEETVTINVTDIYQ